MVFKGSSRAPSSLDNEAAASLAHQLSKSNFTLSDDPNYGIIRVHCGSHTALSRALIKAHSFILHFVGFHIRAPTRCPAQLTMMTTAWKLLGTNLPSGVSFRISPQLASHSVSWCVLFILWQFLSHFKFKLQGLCSSVATTLNTPLLLGGPASVRHNSITSKR